jgi:hypothetical protein
MEETQKSRKRGDDIVSKIDQGISLPLTESSMMTSDSPCKLNIPLHDGDTFGVNCTEISIISEKYQLIDAEENEMSLQVHPFRNNGYLRESKIFQELHQISNLRVFKEMNQECLCSLL